MERTIFHCDLNCFFASVELLEHPELSEAAVAVCGDPNLRHGIILAKNEAAKRCGVKTAETIWQAQRKCPNLVLLSAHHEKYNHYSRIVQEIYVRHTDLVEPFGIDECWLDVTGSLHLFGGDAVHLADELRGVVRRETGLTISVGVAFNKVFAKLGSDLKKPDATSLITRENFRHVVWPLPATDLLFMGRASARVLEPYGIKTIGDLVHFGRAPLEHLLGKIGAQLYEYAAGLEHEPVAPAGTYLPPKSIGNGITFPRNLLGKRDVTAGVSMLADSVAMRLRHAGMKCATLQVTIRDPFFQDICRQKRLAEPACTAQEISAAAMELITDAWDLSAPIRALTITGHMLVGEDEAAQQLDLFCMDDAPQREKRETLERAMDGIRAKFGNDAIFPSSTAVGEFGASKPKKEKR